MKIFEVFKNILKRNQPESNNKINMGNDNWKEKIKCKTDVKEIKKIVEQTDEQIRNKQIKDTTIIILTKDGTLKKEYIEESIQKKYEKILLDELDIQALISIHASIGYEDIKADYDLRDFIEEDEDNLVRLVNKIVEYAKQNAKKNKSEDILKFIPKDDETIVKIKKEIEQIKEENEK